MPVEITIPRLGWSMDYGTFAGWLHADGATINAGDLLFELEGEKAVQEIESFDAGTLCIPADAPVDGEEVQVGQVVGFLLQPGEARPDTVGPRPTRQTADPASPAPPQPAHTQPSATAPTASGGFTPRPTPPPFTLSDRPAGPAARRLARQQGISLSAVSTSDPTGRITPDDLLRGGAGITTLSRVSTPRARRRAAQLGLNWQLASGSGKGGRVRERDILQLAERSRAGQPAAVTTTVAETPPTAPGTHRAASALRRTIAERMLAGVNKAAPVTIHTKVDATNLLARREALRADRDMDAVNVNVLLLQAVAQTLRQHPELNCCWYQEGTWEFSAVNLSIAVDTSQGLLAPVIGNADLLSLADLAAASSDLITRTRAGKATAADLSGGTFTISNLGMLGVDEFTPILNLPQAGCLGIGRIVEEPVVRDGQVVAGRTLALSLTFDHRVIDGAPAARWLQQLADRISRME